MDGFETLIKTPMWAALQRAKDAVFDAQCEFERHGFASDYVYRARGELGTAENNLRRHFKAIAKQGTGEA